MVDLNIVLAGAILAIATYAIRISTVSSRTAELPQRANLLLENAVCIVLAAVAVTSTVYDGQQIADWSRGAGVAAGTVAAALRLPLILVTVIAGATTALLRLLL